MIPKIIHYCWLSNDPYPDNIRLCMDTWRKEMPDYEYIHWNFDRFPKGKSLWVDQAFKYQKYAFAADYIRLYALYNYGGFYLDTDVEVIRSFDPLLELDTAICWQKDVPGLEVAAFGVSPHSPWIKQCLDRYENRSFVKEDGTFDTDVLPEIVEQCLWKNGYQLKKVQSVEEVIKYQNIHCVPVLTSDFFSPKSYLTKQIQLSQHSFCIHHFEGSWKKKTWFEKTDSWLKKHLHFHKNLIGGIVRRYRRIFVKHQ